MIYFKMVQFLNKALVVGHPVQKKIKRYYILLNINIYIIFKEKLINTINILGKCTIKRTPSITIS